MSLLSQVSASLLAPNDLDEGRLQQLLGSLMSHQVEFGDLYFQRSWHESWMLEDGIVKDGSYNIDQGVGVRAVSGEKTGFAYSDELSLLALQQSVTAAGGGGAARAAGARGGP
ncbi:PmbA/TldA family metallopeptidase, partial [Aeromonas intestinalis]